MERPTLDEPLLRKTVVQNRFFHNQVPARYWLNGKPPPNFVLLGNLPPTPGETAIECNVYAGSWDDSSGDEAFLEWRWLHDRPAFEMEVRAREEERERLRRLPQKPTKMMSEDEFWSIIDLLDWRHQGNDAKVLAPAIEALAAKSKKRILTMPQGAVSRPSPIPLAGRRDHVVAETRAGILLFANLLERGGYRRGKATDIENATLYRDGDICYPERTPFIFISPKADNGDVVNMDNYLAEVETLANSLQPDSGDK
jgi:hypothetical protein